MKGFTIAAAAATAFSGVQAALPAVTIKGNAFFAGSERFYIRGLDYQPGGSSDLEDPIAEPDVCKRDIAKFKELGVNAVRIYTVDNSASHDTCMKLLDDAGIYLILDVNSPLYSINREDPRPSYNEVYLQNIFATMDIFSKYSNTLAFFSGNEVINETRASTETAPYVKAVTRDMKTYQVKQKLRKVPIGYSATDVESNRYETAAFFNCGTDDERSDFFAFNDYSWCDPSDYKTAGWDAKVEKFSNYSLPVFLSEHGCNKNTRTFGDVKSLYSSTMTGVYSGGLVYEYSQESSDYGLVNIKNGKVTERPDFDALKKAYKGTPNASGDGGYRPNAGGPSECPASSKDWLPENDDLPAIPEKAKKYLDNGAGKGVGLEGSGSQTAGTPSTGTAKKGSGAGGSGTNSSSDSTDSDSAAPGLHIPEFSMLPLACIAAVTISSLFGASLL